MYLLCKLSHFQDVSRLTNITPSFVLNMRGIVGKCKPIVYNLTILFSLYQFYISILVTIFVVMNNVLGLRLITREVLCKCAKIRLYERVWLDVREGLQIIG